jgi:cytochrome oxidase Cu insertion factor (SCO1/SenC/PrrC family)
MPFPSKLPCATRGRLVAGVAFVSVLAAAAPPSGLKVRVGEKAPDFALTSSSGKTVRLSDYAGRNVLLDFYRAHW